MREQFADSTGAYRTRSCAEQPSLPRILQFCQLWRSGPVLAPVVPRTGWFAIKSQDGRRRINGHVCFPKFGFAVRPRDYRSIANARARVLLRRANFLVIFDRNPPVMARTGLCKRGLTINTINSINYEHLTVKGTMYTPNTYPWDPNYCPFYSRIKCLRHKVVQNHKCVEWP